MDGESKSPQVPATDKQGEEDLWQRHGAERYVWTAKMLEALDKGVKGNKWFSLIDKVSRARTLELAWDRVRSNAGACGVDGITVNRFAKDSQTRLLAVKEQIDRNEYQSQPIKRVWIPKLGSPEKRPLGIPTVRDRVVQTALRTVIEPIFEREFAQSSYGFRPGRGCKDALRHVDKLLKSGYAHVVDIDIKGYFDCIPHNLLMERVRERIADSRVLGLIESFLKAGVMEGLEVDLEREDGTPQGGVISPLLANIYLNPLDHLLKEMGYEMVRYADDMVVLCQDAETARQALEVVSAWMGEASLTLHPQKTRVVSITQAGSHFDFLGFRFWKSKGGRIKRFVRPKSRQKLKARLMPMTKRTNGQCMPAIIQKLNPILKGWYGYFKQADPTEMRGIDGWVRGRLRSILRKRRNLRGRACGTDHHRWPNRYFADLGLFCLEEARAKEFQSP
jgi:RNA-directed DNA polymerase